MVQTKTTPDSKSETVLLDFGNKALTDQNGSKSIIIPRMAWKNCGQCTHVSIQLVRTKDEKFIKLVPQQTKNEGSN